jgi:homoserine kinase
VNGSEKQDWHTAFAPATVANFGSGFDAFAAAIEVVAPAKGRGKFASRPGAGREGARGSGGIGGIGGDGGDGSAGGVGRHGALGDQVSVRRTKSPGVRVVMIEGDGGRLPRGASRNCAGVAAAAVLRQEHAPFGLDLVLRKGLPLSSGLGSSAASAAAGAYAAALALGIAGEGAKSSLLVAALAGEHVADGSWHGDNVFASLVGGGLIVVSTRPAEIVPLRSSSSLRLVIVHPQFELETRRARAVLPKRVTVADAAAQAARFASLVEAWPRGDRRGVGLGLEDRLAEPYRARLVPGYSEGKKAALRAGAFGVTFSGAGPSVLAVTPEGAEEGAGEAIRRAFAKAGLASEFMICRIDARGARAV